MPVTWSPPTGLDQLNRRSPTLCSLANIHHRAAKIHHEGSAQAGVVSDIALWAIRGTWLVWGTGASRTTGAQNVGPGGLWRRQPQVFSGVLCHHERDALM